MPKVFNLHSCLVASPVHVFIQAHAGAAAASAVAAGDHFSKMLFGSDPGSASAEAEALVFVLVYQ